jgi:hypothetical protein
MNEKYIIRLTGQLHRIEERVAAMEMKNVVMMSSGTAGVANKDFLRMGDIMQDRGRSRFMPPVFSMISFLKYSCLPVRSQEAEGCPHQHVESPRPKHCP